MLLLAFVKRWSIDDQLSSFIESFPIGAGKQPISSIIVLAILGRGSYRICMYYTFPSNTSAFAVHDYNRPYADPIAVQAGELLMPDRTRVTDMFGWIWCRARDDREGWVPEAWLTVKKPVSTIRSYSAIELTVTAGDKLRLLFSESGFIWCETDDGSQGWLPDALLTQNDPSDSQTS